MLIDYVIPNARTLDQLNAPTLDGHADENASDNCVATSLAEGLRILTGHTYDPDQLKDAVYGQGVTGFQAAWRYVAYCHTAGVALIPYRGNQAQLVAMLRHEVRQGHPVIVTMPSQWSVAPADPAHPSGTTHVGLAVGIGGTTGLAGAAIRVMNPWHGFMQDESDAWWQARLCEGEIWIMEHTPVAIAPAPAPKPVAAPIPAPVPVAAPKPIPAPIIPPAPVTAPPVAAPAPQPVSVPPTPTAPPDAPVSAPQQPTQQPTQPAPQEAPSMQNPFSIFARAAAGLPLAAWERALLRFSQGLFATFVVAFLGSAQPILASGHFALNQSTMQAMAGAGFTAVILAIWKLFSAKGDAAANASAPTPPAA